MKAAAQYIKERYPFYDENIEHKDVELNGERIKELIHRVQQETAAEIKKRCMEEIPRSWLDPMLTGEKAVVGRPPYGCPEVEVILNAIRQAIDRMEIE